MRTASRREMEDRGPRAKQVSPNVAQIREVTSRIRNEWSEDERCRRALAGSFARRKLIETIVGP